MPKWRIFMSYSHADDETCLMYKRALRARTLDIWSDHEALRFHPSLSEEIEYQFGRCNGFIVLVSEHSLRSDWVMRECQVYADFSGRGTERNWASKRIAVIIGPLPNHSLRFAIIESSMDKIIDATGTSYEAAIEALVAEFDGAPDTLVDDIPAAYLTPYRQEKYGFRGLIKGDTEVVVPPTCEVGGGYFRMGSDRRNDPNSKEDEIPSHRNHVETFRMSTYSITVAEYLCAIQANAVPSPLDWEEQGKHSQNPVVNVSWYDAVAYAQWLSAVTKESWRLPTEAEWELAARGTTGLIYPWGDTWDEEKAGYRSFSGSGKPGPKRVVDLASNVSPYGVIGMCSNIWEWCSSLYEPYPYIAGDGREDLAAPGARVARGGSFLETEALARAASRSKLEPHLYFPDRGFRLVRGQPPADGRSGVGRVLSRLSSFNRVMARRRGTSAPSGI